MNFKILSLNANPNLKEKKLHKQEKNVCESCSLNKFSQNMKKINIIQMKWLHQFLVKVVDFECWPQNITQFFSMLFNVNL